MRGSPRVVTTFWWSLKILWDEIKQHHIQPWCPRWRDNLSRIQTIAIQIAMQSQALKLHIFIHRGPSWFDNVFRTLNFVIRRHYDLWVFKGSKKRYLKLRVWKASLTAHRHLQRRGKRTGLECVWFGSTMGIATSDSWGNELINRYDCLSFAVKIKTTCKTVDRILAELYGLKIDPHRHDPNPNGLQW